VQRAELQTPDEAGAPVHTLTAALMPLCKYAAHYTMVRKRHIMIKQLLKLITVVHKMKYLFSGNVFVALSKI
jgi:hypothetical protein